jgi:hypothetical protein
MLYVDNIDKYSRVTRTNFVRLMDQTLRLLAEHIPAIHESADPDWRQGVPYDDQGTGSAQLLDGLIGAVGNVPKFIAYILYAMVIMRYEDIGDHRFEDLALPGYAWPTSGPVFGQADHPQWAFGLFVRTKWFGVDVAFNYWDTATDWKPLGHTCWVAVPAPDWLRQSHRVHFQITSHAGPHYSRELFEQYRPAQPLLGALEMRRDRMAICRGVHRCLTSQQAIDPRTFPYEDKSFADACHGIVRWQGEAVLQDLEYLALANWVSADCGPAATWAATADKVAYMTSPIMSRLSMRVKGRNSQWVCRYYVVMWIQRGASSAEVLRVLKAQQRQCLMDPAAMADKYPTFAYEVAMFDQLPRRDRYETCALTFVIEFFSMFGVDADAWELEKLITYPYSYGMPVPFATDLGCYASIEDVIHLQGLDANISVLYVLAYLSRQSVASGAVGEPFCGWSTSPYLVTVRGERRPHVFTPWFIAREVILRDVPLGEHMLAVLDDQLRAGAGKWCYTAQQLRSPTVRLYPAWTVDGLFARVAGPGRQYILWIYMDLDDVIRPQATALRLPPLPRDFLAVPDAYEDAYGLAELLEPDKYLTYRP